jgi:hypothetical protein
MNALSGAIKSNRMNALSGAIKSNRMNALSGAIKSNQMNAFLPVTAATDPRVKNAPKIGPPIFIAMWL